MEHYSRGVRNCSRRKKRGPVEKRGQFVVRHGRSVVCYARGQVGLFALRFRLVRGGGSESEIARSFVVMRVLMLAEHEGGTKEEGESNQNFHGAEF